MIETAENLARNTASRARQPTPTPLRSHQRAAAAWQDGRFADEVVPVPVPQKKGEPMRVRARRRHPRRHHASTRWPSCGR